MLCSAAAVATAQTVAPPPPGSCTDEIYRKWNDVLFVNNSDMQYTSYQWYRDGEAIDGATAQYIHFDDVTLLDDGHIYHAVAKRTDGQEVTFCAKPFSEFMPSQPLNPAQAPIRRAALYTSLGRKVGEWSDKRSDLGLPYGYYVWYLEDEEGGTYTERVVIQ